MAANVADATAKVGQVPPANACCQVWWKKYSKTAEGRIALKKAVHLLQNELDRVQAENLCLKKAGKEVQAQANMENQDRGNETITKVSSKNETSTLKSEIAHSKQKVVSDAQERNEEIKLLRVRVSEGEKKIKQLKELVEKEKRRADLERENAAAEKKKAAQAWETMKGEKGKTDEERSLANLERKRAEDFRFQCEALRKEVSEVKSKLAFELLKSQEATKVLERQKEKVIEERKRADYEMARAEEQRKLAEADRRRAVEEKSSSDNLFEELKVARRRIEELEKAIDEIHLSRKFVDPPSEHQDVHNEAEVSKKGADDSKLSSKVKLLKKQLKFKKMQATQAKELAKLEKGRSNILQLELCHLKLELVQLSHRLDVVDQCFSPSAEGIDGRQKLEDVTGLQSLSLEQNPYSLPACQNFPQKQNQHLKPGWERTSSPLTETYQHSAPLLSAHEGNCIESVSGIDSKLGSLLGGSNTKMLQSSAINSRTPSFSDRQLVGSQERGAFSVTTSAKTGEENFNVQPTISGMSSEVSKNRHNGNLAVVAENSVRSPFVDTIGRVNGHGKKRKRMLDAVESIEHLCSKGKKLHKQVEDKISVLHGMLRRQKEKPGKEAEVMEANGCKGSDARHDVSPMKRDMIHGDKVVMKEFCDGTLLKGGKNVDVVANQAANVCRQAPGLADHLVTASEPYQAAMYDFVAIGHEPVIGFEEVVNGDYMRLLDLENAADEECYKMAAEMPLSPNLPEIESTEIEKFNIDSSQPSVDEIFFEVLSSKTENVASSCSFDVLSVEIDSNKSKDGIPDSTNTFLQHNNEGCKGESIKFHFESEVGASTKNILKYCVVFSDIKDASTISRIFSSTRNCVGQCFSAAQGEWVVDKILCSLKMEINLSAREKACVFHSLVLHNFSVVYSGECCVTKDILSHVNSFSGHIDAVMCDTEARSVFAQLYLDGLFTLLEDFLIHGRVVLHHGLSSESMEHLGLRDVSIIYEAASSDQLVAGSIILASLCTAVDYTGFICEAAYNIFQMHRHDISVVLSIFHVFAHLIGDNVLTSRKHSLEMVLLQSIGTFFSKESYLVTEDTCFVCPIIKGAVSVDKVFSLLMEKLHIFTGLEIMQQDVIPNMNCNAFCCLDECKIGSKQSECGGSWTLCHAVDVFSLVELIAYNMSWEWTCNKIILQLLKMLEAQLSENLSVAVIVLLGQLGRLGVDAAGYEDKGVEDLRMKLSALLLQDTTIKAGLPMQMATLSALFEVVNVDFLDIVQSSTKVQGDMIPSDYIRSWYYSLSIEQQALARSVF